MIWFYNRIIHVCPNDAEGMAKSVDPDQEQFYLDLHSLLRPVFQNHFIKNDNHFVLKAVCSVVELTVCIQEFLGSNIGRNLNSTRCSLLCTQICPVELGWVGLS